MGKKSVCLSCHVSYNNGINYYKDKDIYLRICPQCRKEMKDLTYRFKPPKKDEVKKWEIITYLLDYGFYFQHIHDYEHVTMAKYPEELKEAKLFVKKYNEQKLEIFKLFDIIKHQNIMSVGREIEIVKYLQQIHLWQIINEKEKFKTILEKIKIYHLNNNIQKDDYKIKKEHNNFRKWLNNIKKYFNENEQKAIVEIINIIEK